MISQREEELNNSIEQMVEDLIGMIEAIQSFTRVVPNATDINYVSEIQFQRLETAAKVLADNLVKFKTVSQDKIKVIKK